MCLPSGLLPFLFPNKSYIHSAFPMLSTYLAHLALFNFLILIIFVEKLQIFYLLPDSRKMILYHKVSCLISSGS